MRKITNEELNRPTIEDFQKLDKIPVVIVADNVRSLNNIGSMFRTGDAFAIESICLCGITATPPNKEIHKTALGAESSVQWEFFENTIDAVSKFRAEGYTVLAIEQVEGAIMLDEFVVDRNKKYMLIFGNEVKGVDQKVVDICDGSIEIPQVGTKHSLNVSVSVGVVLWEFFKKLSKVG